MPIRRATVFLLVLFSTVSNSCNDKSTGPTDTTRPSAITNLAIDVIAGGKILYSWTATGDDSKKGTATYYDLRSAADTATLKNWGGARQQQGEPAPAAFGTQESMNLPDTFSVSTYFAIKVSDEAENTSSMSNIVSRLR
ncbi:MAG: hypothetical protein WBP29_09020 [Candidatus Zixiibacteriota bacterium]